jgi:SAM-dependent methyltransferase
MKIVTSDRNLTIPYDQGVCPYHTILAGLISKYAKPGHARILDVGCGVGNTLVELSKLHPEMKTVIADVDPTCLELTRQKVKVQKEILLQSPEDLYRLDEEFDIIILSHTLHYDPEPYRAIKKLLSILVPGGYLMIATPNPITPTKILHNVIRRHYSVGIYAWDRSVLRNFIESFGWVRLVEITQDYLPLPWLGKFQFMSPCLRFLSQLLPWLSFSIILVVEKSESCNEH